MGRNAKLLPANEVGVDHPTTVSAPVDIHATLPIVCGAGSRSESAINSLPPEVLLEIFYHLHSLETEEMPFDLEDLEEGEMSMKICPTSVSNVCTHWDLVSAMAPTLWKCDLVVIDVMKPNPARRLQARLSRLAPDAREIRVRIWSALPTDLTVDPHLIEKAKLVERWRMKSLTPIIAQYSDRFLTLQIVPILASSLPTLPELLPGFLSGHRHDDLFKIRIDSLTNENDRFRVPHEAMNPESSSREDYYAIPNYSPYLLEETGPTVILAHSIQWLSLSGATFVSFCRSLLTNGHSAAVFHRRGRTLHVGVSFVEPDSGCETPFTLVEFLSAIRLLCGMLENLRLTDVNLPVPTPTPSTSGAITQDPCHGFEWPRCNPVDHTLEFQPLGQVDMKRVGMAVKLGIREIILAHHRSVEKMEKATLWWHDEHHKFIADGGTFTDVDWDEVVTGNYSNKKHKSLFPGMWP